MEKASFVTSEMNSASLEYGGGSIKRTGLYDIVMARKACCGGVLPGFKPLAQTDIERIFEMCL